MKKREAFGPWSSIFLLFVFLIFVLGVSFAVCSTAQDEVLSEDEVDSELEPEGEWFGVLENKIQIDREYLQQLLNKHKYELPKAFSGEKPGFTLDLTKAFLSGVDLRKADLSGVILSRSNLTKADLSQSRLWNTNLTGAIMIGADLSGAILRGTNLTNSNLADAKLTTTVMEGPDLTGAIMIGADLTDAQLFHAKLTGVILSGANLTNVRYEPKLGALPDIPSMVNARGLSTLKFDSPHGLAELREAFKKAGMRTQEREVTYALKRGENAFKWDNSKKLLSNLLVSINAGFNYVFFDFTCHYGMDPNRPLLIILLFVALCSIPYMLALYTKSRRTSIWIIQLPDRIEPSAASAKPIRVNSRRAFHPPPQGKFGKLRWTLYRLVRVARIALYSAIPAGHSTCTVFGVMPPQEVSLRGRRNQGGTL